MTMEYLLAGSVKDPNTLVRADDKPELYFVPTKSWVPEPGGWGVFDGRSSAAMRFNEVDALEVPGIIEKLDAKWAKLLADNPDYEMPDYMKRAANSFKDEGGGSSQGRAEPPQEQTSQGKK